LLIDTLVPSPDVNNAHIILIFVESFIMKRAKYIVRAVFLALTIFLLVDLNRKTDDNAQSVAQFKFKMFNKMRSDSLDSKRKMDLLLNETTKFVDQSTHVKSRIHDLILLFGFFVIVELTFFILKNRNSRSNT